MSSRLMAGRPETATTPMSLCEDELRVQLRQRRRERFQAQAGAPAGSVRRGREHTFDE